MYKQKHITVIIPALDEELSIAKVITELRSLKESQGQKLIDDIIVCDNDSTDATASIASVAGARVVTESHKGYGAACLKALSAIHRTDIILFIDADHAFFAGQSTRLLDAIIHGSDMVIGSRTLGHAAPRALTFAQRFGNHLATSLIHLIWQHQYTDLGPFRAICCQALQRLNMEDKAYGWTVEMQVKALQLDLQVTEVPVDTRVRIGHSKISGTVKGTIKAGVGIIGMIAKLRWQQARFKSQASLQNG